MGRECLCWDIFSAHFTSFAKRSWAQLSVKIYLELGPFRWMQTILPEKYHSGILYYIFILRIIGAKARARARKNKMPLPNSELKYIFVCDSQQTTVIKTDKQPNQNVKIIK
jgi:hypothetical protein